ncbi:MAG: NBR1-Ig-like domain-containing protein [Patescibacteria group bacterium]|nr:NBR1-Ig-like domain-containing protein [Patescibacteria group bacterium]
MAISIEPVGALTGANFNAGHIIDDVIFTNSSSMSVQDIQYFLDTKVPNCDTSGTQNSSHYNSTAGRYYTRAEWGSISGSPAPYTCLKNYRENITTHQNNVGNPSASIDNAKTAAEIIYNSAKTYSINPQVLLTTLQKEQGLITDDWPWPIQYRSAMGFGCPDTSACDTKYYGFYNQVDSAAYQFKYYLTHPNAFNYWTGDNFIRYNPDSSCGGTNVNIQNPATAALYIYTPYQPNASSLSKTTGTSAGGSGDNCGAYGNRNFWWYFNTWFGSTLTSGYDWQPVQQSAYTDSTMTTPVDTLSLLPGQRFYLQIKAKNMGSVTWQKGVAGRQVNLGTSNPRDRKSLFCDSTWLGTDCNRATSISENTIAPGDTGTFGLWATAPKQIGMYSEYFNPVMDGTSWLIDRGLYWTFKVTAPSWQPVQQSAYTDSTMTTPVDTANMLPNQRYYLILKAKNNGPATWQKGVAGRQVNLGTSGPRDRASGFCDSTWLGSDCNRVATTTEDSVASGATGTFAFWIKTPSRILSYDEHFNLVMDGVSWMSNDPGLYWTMRTNPIHLNWQPVQQSAYTDSTMTTPVDTNNLQHGQKYYLVLKAKNTGNNTWQKGVSLNQVNLGTSHSRDRKSVFCDTLSWLNTDCNRPATANEASVAPGQTGTFGFTITSPAQAGSYNEYLDLVLDGVSWAETDPGLYWTFKVN